MSQSRLSSLKLYRDSLPEPRPHKLCPSHGNAEDCGGNSPHRQQYRIHLLGKANAQLMVQICKRKTRPRVAHEEDPIFPSQLRRAAARWAWGNSLPLFLLWLLKPIPKHTMSKIFKVLNRLLPYICKNHSALPYLFKYCLKVHEN